MTVNRDMIDDYVNSIYKIDMVGHSLVDSDKSALNFYHTIRLLWKR